MKKAKFITGIVIIITLLVGCSKRDTVKYEHSYIGKSNNWNIEYKVSSIAEFKNVDNKLSYDGTAKKELTLEYKGDINELSKSKKLEYSVESSVGKYNTEENISNGINKNVFKHVQKYTKGAALEAEDEIITVIIKLNNKSETIKLKSL